MTAALLLPQVCTVINHQQFPEEIFKIYKNLNSAPGYSNQSFPDFSNNLNECFSYDSIADCLFTSLNHAHDFVLMRFSFYHNNSTISYTLTNTCCHWKKASVSELWQQELFFLEEPVISNETNRGDFERQKIIVNEQLQNVYGFNHTFDNKSGILVSFITEKANLLVTSYVTNLKLAAEELYSKLLSFNITEKSTGEIDEPQTEFENLQTGQHVLSIVKEI